jgi:hypothetical protein
MHSRLRQELFFLWRALLEIQSELPLAIGVDSPDTKVDAALRGVVALARVFAVFISEIDWSTVADA